MFQESIHIGGPDETHDSVSTRCSRIFIRRKSARHQSAKTLLAIFSSPMITRTLLLFFLFITNVVLGQVELDTVTGDYKYHCSGADKLIVSGKPQLIFQSEGYWLYEIKIDSILFGVDTIARNCTTVYMISYRVDEQKRIDSATVFVLTRCFHSAKDQFRPCEYYRVTSILPVPLDRIVAIIPFVNQSEKSWIESTCLDEDPIEKIVVKRRKKNCQ